MPQHLSLCILLPLFLCFVQILLVVEGSETATATSIYPTPYQLLGNCSSTDAKRAELSSFDEDKTPNILSVIPSSIYNATVVLRIEIKNAKSILKTNNLLIYWTWAWGTERTVDLSKRSTLIKLTPPSEGGDLGDTFYVHLEFQKDTKNACKGDLNSKNKTHWDGFCPLWERQTYYYARLSSSANKCDFTSKESKVHGRMLSPCPAGTYMRVLKNDIWFNKDINGLNVLNPDANSFLDFSFRPVDKGIEDTANRSTVCMPCNVNQGLECPKGSAGFHGGVIVKKGWWRVDFSSSSKFAAARCNKPSVCDAGGRCMEGLNRQGPLCEICEDGYALDGGECVSCEVYQDFGPLLIIFCIILLFGILILLFRHLLHKFRFLWRDILRISKVIIDTSQILAAMPVVLNGVYWPDEILRLFDYFSLASLDFTGIIGLRCVNGKALSYYAKASFLLACMFVVTVVLCIGYVLMNYRRRIWWDSKATEEEKEQFSQGVFSTIFRTADHDESGTLCETEISHILEKLAKKDTVDNLMSAFLKKNNDEMGHDDFISFMIEWGKENVEERSTIIMHAYIDAKVSFFCFWKYCCCFL
jgi:hypothetical protein